MYNLSHFLPIVVGLTPSAESSPLAFWKSKSGFEVDFVLGDHTAIDLKATENVGSNGLKFLRAVAEERKVKRYLCISLEARRRQVGKAIILPIPQFLRNLWDGSYS